MQVPVRRTMVTGKVACLLFPIMVAFCCIVVSAEARAGYSKRIIVVSGQPAPGTDGAVFAWESMRIGGISESGRVLFTAKLEVGVGDATTSNNHGVWVSDPDSLPRLLARAGTEVNGKPGQKFHSFLWNHVFITPSGEIGLNAEYSPDGDPLNTSSGFFVEENGTLVEKVKTGDSVLAGITLKSVDAHAFNGGRVLFRGVLQGEDVHSWDCVASCIWDVASGITVLSRNFNPMPLVDQRFKIDGGGAGGALSPGGRVILQMRGYDSSTRDVILVVYSWDPVSGYMILRNSGIIPHGSTPDAVFADYERMNSVGDIALRGPAPSNTYDAIWRLDQQPGETLIVADSGHTAEGTDGATFSRLEWSWHVLFDDGQVGLWAETSDNNKTGIWIGDESGMWKVAYPGDQAPGVGEDMKFFMVNNMTINRSGKVAFSDFALDTAGNELYGIWAGDADGLELVAVQNEQIEIDSGDVRTLSSYLSTGVDVLNRTGADGFPTAYNDQGDLVILVEFNEGGSALLVASPSPGLVVNSVEDTEDADTTDGICNTGGPPVYGKPECTLRAAIMEANNQAGPDTITFNIPGDEIPTINYVNNLPTITDPVLIDGTTQPAGLVELDGYIELAKSSGTSDPPEITHGYVVETDGFELRGKILNRFTGYGILIQNCTGATIQQCYIGKHPGNMSEDRGSRKHGIMILNSADVTIGGLLPGSENVIAFNKEAGIFIEETYDGGSNGNRILRNNIYNNEQLGIDIAPQGVNENDIGKLDGDTGANGKVNFPIIDSIKAEPVDWIKIFATMDGDKNNAHHVFFFYNDICEKNGYGEGQVFETSGVVNTNETGVGHLEVVADPLGESQYISATATDEDDNTSEFSLCWPQKAIIIKDQNGNPFANTEFEIYNVRHDAPKFTETLVDKVTTDEKGRVDLNKYYREISLSLRDSVRIHKHLHSEPRTKTGIPILETGYSVYLDNAEFNPNDCVMSYDELTHDTLQEIKLEHTTVAVNLVVSIEWDANDYYRDSLKSALRHCSNYLYDVTDGQVRFDTIVIYDDREQWDNADMQILAENSLRSSGYVGGFFKTGETYICVPRCWYGTGDLGMEQSWYDYPTSHVSHNEHYTWGHELGHYFFGFYDEYEEDKVMGRMGRQAPIYGFMQIPRPPGQLTTEMSWSRQYNSVGRKKTEQWIENKGRSCWKTFQDNHEKTYGGIQAPITMPEERTLPAGWNYYNGPNDYDATPFKLNYDVGEAIVFHDQCGAQAASDFLQIFLDPSTAAPLPRMGVMHRRQGRQEGEYMNQGSTSSCGKIRILGANIGDRLETYGGHLLYTFPPPKRGSRHSAETFAWFSGEFEITSMGESTFYPSPVHGEFPLIVSCTPSNSVLTLELEAKNPFASSPSVQMRTQSGETTDYSFAVSPSGYTASISDDPTSNGVFRITAIDDSASSFFFQADYALCDVSDGTVRQYLLSEMRDFKLTIDSSNAAVNQAIVVSTDFPELRGTLPPEARRVSRVHSIGMDPSQYLSGDNHLQLSYSSLGLDHSGLPFMMETSVRLFHWNEDVSEWEKIGCSVDSVSEVVHAYITELGAYAVFTTESVGDTVAPEVTMGVLQNPVLPAYIDIYVIADEALWGPPAILANASDLLVEEVANETAPTYTARYELTGAESVTLRAIVNDLGFNTADVTETFESFPAGPSASVWNSLDGRMQIRMPKDALTTERYLLYFKGADADGAIYDLRPHILKMARDVELRIAVPETIEDKLADEMSIARQKEDKTWELLPTSRDQETGMLMAHIDRLGVFALRANAKSDVNKPLSWSLEQNYPNPFNPSTVISFSLAKRCDVLLEVINILGQRVKTLADKEMDGGEHTTTWNGKNEQGDAVASGVYFYRLRTDFYSKTRRMVLLK